MRGAYWALRLAAIEEGDVSFRHLLTPGERQPVESPCVKICVIEDDGLCVGCARTLDEIARWSQMTPQERRTLMAQLPARRRERGRL